MKQQLYHKWDASSCCYSLDKKFSRDSKLLYNEIDKYFISVNSFAQDDNIPFSKLIDYSILKNKRVLEIGCGAGTMAASFAKRGAKVFVVDISEDAIALTKERFHLFNLKGNFYIMNAARLNFQEDYFDLVFSCGVLHHLPDISRAIEEIYRILKKGGEARILLYNKGLFSYYSRLIKRGIFQFQFLYRTPQDIMGRYMDTPLKGGVPIANVYSRKEIEILFRRFSSLKINICGPEAELNCFPYSKLPLFKYLPSWLKVKLLRKWGSFLYIIAKK